MRLEYDVLYWDRFDLREKHERGRCFYWPDKNSIARRLVGYFLYRRFLRHEIGKTEYDKFIILGTQVGLLLGDVLRGKKYLLDIRDFSHENVAIYHQAVSKLIRDAQLVFISSRGFLEWLPKEKSYVISHNMSPDDFSIVATPFDSGTRIVSFIGIIEYFEANKQAIDELSRFPEYLLRFVGEGSARGKLEEYCRKNRHTNVEFTGAFSPSQKTRWYEETNFVLACYGADSPVVRTLIPNRLYESCIRRRPIIVTGETHLGTVVWERGIGVVLGTSNKNTIGFQLEEFYDVPQYDSYCKRCEEFLGDVRVDMHEFEAQLRGALKHAF